MGNCCCPTKKITVQEPSKISNADNKKIDDLHITDPSVNFEITLNGVNIILKIGDIVKEQADAIVSGIDNYIKNRSTSDVAPSVKDSLNRELITLHGVAPLMNGEVFITGPGDFKNVQNIIHIAVPLWRGGNHKELEQLTQGFQKALEEASKNRLSSVIFTDVAGSLFGIPKQHTARVLFNVVNDYAENYGQENKLTTIKFVHKKRQSVVIFVDALKSQIGIRDDRETSNYSDHLGGSKITDQVYQESEIKSIITDEKTASNSVQDNEKRQQKENKNKII